MAGIDVGKYIDELREFSGEGGDLDMYSLKKELNELSGASGAFESFEREYASIDKDSLEQIKDLSLLMKVKALASEIRNKRQINDKLHSLHFNLNILKNSSTASGASPVKNALNAFLYDKDTKIGTIVDELNHFKSQLEELKKHHSSLLPKGLDNDVKIETKYNKHIERLHCIHKKQRNVLVSAAKLFLKLAKEHIKNLQRFKKEN